MSITYLCSKSLSSCLLVVLLSVSGCSRYNEEVQAVIELEPQTSTPEIEAKRSGIKRLLNAFQEGVKQESDLLFSAGNIRFQHSVDEFYDGHQRLIAWQFVGDPDKDTHRVELHFDDKEFGPIASQSLSKVYRNYRVSQSGGKVTVREVR